MLYRDKPAKIFTKYAIPQMIGLLLNSVYLIVDGIFIGNRLGREAMAAAAVSVPVVEIFIALALLVSSGAGVMISNRLGRKESKEANNIFNLSVRVLAAASIIIAILGNLIINPLASFLGATPDIHSDAVSYLWYIITFSPFLLFSFLLSGLARNDNRPKLAMLALTVGSVSNIILDYVFMYPLNMGIAGAALATALGPIFSVMILLPHFLKKKGLLHFARLNKTPGGVKKIFTLGFPAFVMEFTIGIVTFIYNFAIVKYGYGELGLAAYLIIGYMALIILTVFLGISQGLQPVFSYYHGGGESKRLNDLLGFSKKAILITGAALYALTLIFARGFTAIFSANDTELLSFTSSKAAVYFWGFIIAGYNILSISFWQSTGKARRALLVSLLRSVLILPILIIALPLIFGSESIWVSHSISEAASAAAVALFFVLGVKKESVKEKSKLYAPAP